MKNKGRPQKKVLSLVLCVAVMLSVMVVGAGAAFSDQGKIQNAEAVDACVALNIINGYDDGTYRPESNVTRAEVTKMICIALNGGKEPALGTVTTPTFNDVRTDKNSAWAEAYIESCVAQGIVAGTAPGKFEPSNSVTGTELAKMLLVSLGYKSENEGFIGNGWDVKVNTVASAKGLYEDLESVDVSSALTRDSAAQMIWNALNAYEVEYKTVLTTENGQLTSQITVQDKVVGSNDDKITLMEDKYETETPTGILTAVTKEDGKDTYNVTVVVKNAQTGDTYPKGEQVFSKVSGNYVSLLGQDVKVLVKPENNGKDAVVYGVYATDKNTTVTTLKDDIDDLDKTPLNKIKVDGKEYKTALDDMNDLPVYYATDFTDNYTKTTPTPNATLEDLADYEYVTLIDNNDDDKIDIGVVTPVTFAQISYLSSSNVGLDIMGGYQTNVETSYDLDDDDVILYQDAEEDDYVVITDGAFTADGNTVIAKASVVNGEVSAVKGDKPITDVRVDGTWYSVIDGKDTKDLKLNKTFDLAVYGSFVFACEKTASSANADDVLFIDKAAAITSGVAKDDGNIEAKAYFTDGTSQTITISEVNYVDKAGDDQNVDADEYTSRISATNVTAAFADKMWMFEMDGSEYELTALDDTYETLSYDNYKSGASTDSDKLTLKDGKFGGVDMRVADDAVIFVKTDDEIKVVSGSTVVNWSEIKSDSTTKITSAAGLTDESNGYNYIQVGAIVLAGTDDVPGGSDYSYGYVTENPVTSKSGTTNYTTLTIWNGTETIEITGKTSDGETGDVVKGDFISYSMATDEYVKVEEIQKVGDAVAITAYDADGATAYGQSDVDYADEYVIIGVDTKNVKGVTGVKVDKADEVKAGTGYFVNAVVFLDDGEISAVFMASTNRMYDVDAKTYSDDTALTTSGKSAAEVENIVSNVAKAETFRGGYTPVGDFESKDNAVTVTYDTLAQATTRVGKTEDGDPEGVMTATADLARFLGSLHEKGITSIVYKDIAYTWDKDGTHKGSNWVDSSKDKKSLVSAIATQVGDTLTEASTFPATGSITLTLDGVNYTYGLVITAPGTTTKPAA